MFASNARSPILKVHTPEDVELLMRLMAAEAREDFYAFRRYVHPDLLLGWWQADLARHLMQFYRDLVAGKRPYLIISAPPQHGKSTSLQDFIAWLLGKLPHLKIIFTSYSDKLGVDSNLAIQRTMGSEQYKEVFHKIRLPTKGESWLMNTELIELPGYRGRFVNTTINGQINGMGLDVGVIDDPIKGRKEALSLPVRNSVWGWLTDDFFSRFANHAGMIIIMTRWHVDDPVGRWMAKHPNTKIVRYAALAEDPDDWTVRAGYRRVGDVLFPEHKDKAFILERKETLTQSSFQSLYQGDPIIAGGDLFPIEQFKVVEPIDRKRIKRSVRYWDKAGTKGGGAYTAGVLMHELDDRTFYVEDVRRGQWSASEREKMIKLTADADRAAYKQMQIWVEQEPGSGGKESAELTIQNLAGHSIHKDRVSGDKYTRAEPYAAQVQNGNVLLRAAEWNLPFIDEHETFPNGKFKDQVDSAAGAFMKITIKTSTYDKSMSWVRGATN